MLGLVLALVLAVAAIVPLLETDMPAFSESAIFAHVGLWWVAAVVLPLIAAVMLGGRAGRR